jgi:hypothetical protein
MKANRRIISRSASLNGATSFRRRTLVWGVFLLLGSCVGPPQAPTPGPVVVRPVATLPPRSSAPSDWHDAPITPGDWQWSREGARSIARFGAPQQAALLSLTCNPGTGTITLTRSGTRSGDSSGQANARATISIYTTSLSRSLATQPASEGAVVAALAGHDPLLDAMAYSRGRFAVNVAGQAALYVPNWPEVSRVIEDCR